MKSDIISKENILKELFSKHRLGIKPGLERTLILSDSVGNPHDKFKSIHVAGTNGKGSVCSTLSSVFTEAGFKTGLYTSPHLIDFNERIKIDGNCINDEKIIEYYNRLKISGDKINATFFEITTVMAFMYFAESNVDIAVIETGMGGRFDSTNIILPILSIITKIDFDHSEFLGDSLEQISYEKAGIIKQDVPCVISKNTRVVYDFIKKSSKSDNLHFSEYFGDVEFIKEDIESSTWIYMNNKINYTLSGVYQIDNIKTILFALKLLAHHLPVEIHHIAKGLQNVKNNSGLRARLEILFRDPLVILDGSHNTNSFENLYLTIKKHYPSHKWTVIFNVMSDKNTDGIFSYINDLADEVIIPGLRTERAYQNRLLKEKFIEKQFNKVVLKDSVDEAIKFGISKSKRILICGSFYLAGEVLEYFERSKP
ncbi:MAG: folylpolyglutamate synthase/dihydrofolate synthase family protein [Candidatus Kapaibacterium sp.]